MLIHSSEPFAAVYNNSRSSVHTLGQNIKKYSAQFSFEILSLNWDFDKKTKFFTGEKKNIYIYWSCKSLVKKACIIFSSQIIFCYHFPFIHKKKNHYFYKKKIPFWDKKLFFYWFHEFFSILTQIAKGWLRKHFLLYYRCVL